MGFLPNHVGSWHKFGCSRPFFDVGIPPTPVANSLKTYALIGFGGQSSGMGELEIWRMGFLPNPAGS